MPTPIVQTRQKSDEDEPRLGEEDRRAYHRCVDILQTSLDVSPRHRFCSPRGQVSNVKRIHEGSEVSNVMERRERVHTLR